MNNLEHNAGNAAAFLKGLASPHRLMILCHLVDGEKTVSELIDLTNLAQTSMSQHLAKLKKEGLVDYRRDHRYLYYSISNPAVLEVMQVLYKEFCNQ